jgi:hypothetical protein
MTKWAIHDALARLAVFFVCKRSEDPCGVGEGRGGEGRGGVFQDS